MHNMDEDVAEISILLADNSAPVTADRQLLSVVSSILKGMPASPTWDLRGLLINGAPASRRMLLDWLNKAYGLVHGEPYDAAAAADAAAGAPAAVARACELVMFADAAGSSKGLMAACCTDLEAVRQLRVQLPRAEGGQPQELVLEMDGRAYFSDHGHWTELSRDCKLELGGVRQAMDVEVQPRYHDAAIVQESVAAQLEQLLYCAAKCKLEPVLQRVRTFLGANTCLETTVLFSEASLQEMLGARVQEAAKGTSLAGWCQPWALRNMGGLPVRFSRTCCSSLRDDEVLLLRTVNMSPEDRQPIHFTVRMPRDFMCWRRGEEVQAELRLFEDADADGGDDDVADCNLVVDGEACVDYPCLILGGKPIGLSMVLRVHR